MKFSDRLSRILSGKKSLEKISGSEIARLLEVHPTRVSEWIKNKVNPTYETILKISRGLGIAVSELTGDTPNPDPGWLKIPILGEVPAGNPTEAIELIIRYFSVSEDLKNQMDFGLIVKGDSMTGAGINNGDVVFVKHQPVAENRQIIEAIAEYNS